MPQQPAARLHATLESESESALRLRVLEHGRWPAAVCLRVPSVQAKVARASFLGFLPRGVRQAVALMTRGRGECCEVQNGVLWGPLASPAASSVGRSGGGSR